MFKKIKMAWRTLTSKKADKKDLLTEMTEWLDEELAEEEKRANALYDKLKRRRDDLQQQEDRADDIHEQMEKMMAQEELENIADSLAPGDLSNNTNWVGIEKVGKYLSPIGNDKKHLVALTKSKGKSGTIHVATFECTNSIYSEWVSCLCETMWHIEHKVLEDIHGNMYPVGQMLEMQCSIRYMNV